MLFEVILRGSYFGKNILNRWHYNSSGTPAAASLSFALASAFGGIPAPITAEFPVGSIMNLIAGIVSTEYVFVELQVEALYSVTDFYSIPYPPSQNGGATGTAMSTFYAYALQSNRVRTDVRRGNKRLAGVSEAFVDANGTISNGMPALLDDLAEAMSDALTYDDEGNIITFAPAVLSFEKHAPDVDHDDFWYSKYSTLALQLEHAALNVVWSPKARATTQNTRK